MALPYYIAYRSILTTPANDWKDDLQALVDSEFENSSSYYTIQEETAVGALIWQNVNVRVNHVVYSETGEKLGDDFKSIIFQDFTHAKAMGYRYQFDSNVWVTINTDQKKYVTASAVIRRCNNVLEKRKSDGSLIQEPCFIDYGMASDSFNIFKETVLADGEILVCAQNNANTQLFDINDEVVFGGQAFKIESKKDFLNNTTYGDDPPLITWKMKKVDVSGDGDITPSNEILIFPEDTRSIVLGDTQIFTCYKFEDGIQQVDTFTFSVDSSSQVSASKYTLTTIGGNSFSVKNNVQDTTYPLIVLCTDTTDASTQTVIRVITSLLGSRIFLIIL